MTDFSSLGAEGCRRGRSPRAGIRRRFIAGEAPSPSQTRRRWKNQRGKGDRVMKKLVMFVLLLLAFVATAANAQCSQGLPAHRPIFDRLYACAYAQGAWAHEATNGGGWLFIRARPHA